MLKRSGFNIHLSTSNTKLKYVINNRKNKKNGYSSNNNNDNKKCQWNKCLMKNEFCHQKMVIYKLECYTCHKTYIGSTIRPMHVRYMEHVETHDGIIKTHSRYCLFPNFVTEIIDRVHGDGEIILRIKEAIWIKKLQPTLNSKEEINKLLDIITD